MLNNSSVTDYLNLWNTEVEHISELVDESNYHYHSQLLKLKEDNNLFQEFIELFQNRFSEFRRTNSNNYPKILTDSISLLPKILEVIHTQESEYFISKNISYLDVNRPKKMLEIYVELSQASFLDSARIIGSIISAQTSKEIDFEFLNKGVEFLGSKKRGIPGFKPFADLINKEIRNAKDHNGVEFLHDQYHFEYGTNEKHSFNVNYLILEQNIANLFTALKAFLTCVIEQLIDLDISFEELVEKYQFIDARWSKIYLSSHENTCTRFEVTKIMGDPVQLLLNFQGIDADVEQRLWFMTVSMVRALETSQNFNLTRVFISYECPHSITGSTFIQTASIEKYIIKEISFEDLKILVSKNALLFPLNKDTIVSGKMSYNDIITKKYRVREITDISVENLKRFKAITYIPEPENKKQLQLFILEIINKLRKLQNVSDGKEIVKHGEMNADVVYLDVYYTDGGNRSLMSNNDNFITSVQYDKNSHFAINNSNPLLDHLISEQKSTLIEYRWNPSSKLI